MNKPKLVLFGTGYMGLEYTKVLQTQGIDFIIVGRGQKSAKAFEQQTGIAPFIGGASRFLTTSDYICPKAIVAVSGDQLGNVTLALINKGVKSILVEKPGGLNPKEIKQIRDASVKNSAKVFVAYNRRFYASVLKAQKIIAADGGVLSFHFEFNEPIGRILKDSYPKIVKDLWLLHNSSHVIDLAFFLGGIPISLGVQTFKNQIFTGQGISQNKSLFTYHANWIAPGRWGVEIMTKNHRLIFRPMERLKTQKRGSFVIVDINIDDKLDIEFKPGIYRQVESFLSNQHSLCTIEEQFKNLKWYNQILKG